MDRPILYPLLAELGESERFSAFVAALPAPARVSEPALPVLLAALHEEVERGLVLLAPEDADARDAAEGAAWFLGDDRVALLPSRGVHSGSGLEPPPHLVGERARALDVLAQGGLVCASASAVAEPLPPPETRPEPIRVAPGAEVSLETLTEALALAGYERVERADERGQFAVRGGRLRKTCVSGSRTRPSSRQTKPRRAGETAKSRSASRGSASPSSTMRASTRRSRFCWRSASPRCGNATTTR